MPDSLAEGLGEVPAKDVATYAKAATDEAAKWAKRIDIALPIGLLCRAMARPTPALFEEVYCPLLPPRIP